MPSFIIVRPPGVGLIGALADFNRYLLYNESTFCRAVFAVKQLSALAVPKGFEPSCCSGVTGRQPLLAAPETISAGKGIQTLVAGVEVRNTNHCAIPA